MIPLFRLFFTSRHVNPWLVLLALLLATVAEGLGVATLLPMISVAADPDGVPSSALDRFVRDTLERFGFSIDLGSLLVVVVSILVLRSVLRLVAARYVGNASAEISTAVRRRLVDALLKVRWRFLVDQPLGRVANVMSSEANRAGRAYTVVAELIANFVQALVFAVISFFVSWRIALLAAAVGLGIAAALHVLVRTSRRAGRKQTNRTKELLIFLSDTLSNLKPVRAMGKERAYENLLEGRIAGLRKSMRRQVFAREALSNLQDIALAILLGAGFWVAHMVWGVPVAELVVVGILLYRTVASIGKVQKAHQVAMEFESAYLHAEQVIAEAEADPEPNPGRRVPSFDRSIRLDRVSFAHGDLPVLREVSLEVEQGAMTVLVGPSGSGKTTILDLILGLHRPDGGRILIDGVSLEEIDLVAWRRMIGYVPQENVLFHDSILANVTLGDTTLSEADARAALEVAGGAEFVDALPDGIHSDVGEKGARLSGGQRQRVALARAIASRPRLLIVDEVTSALDPATATAVVERLKALTGEMAILAITHRPELLEIANRAYRIETGTAWRERLADRLVTSAK
jgi:ATP-binding cassette subfamily C protein